MPAARAPARRARPGGSRLLLLAAGAAPAPHTSECTFVRNTPSRTLRPCRIDVNVYVYCVASNSVSANQEGRRPPGQRSISRVYLAERRLAETPKVQPLLTLPLPLRLHLKLLASQPSHSIHRSGRNANAACGRHAAQRFPRGRAPAAPGPRARHVVLADAVAALGVPLALLAEV